MLYPALKWCKNVGLYHLLVYYPFTAKVEHSVASLSEGGVIEDDGRSAKTGEAMFWTTDCRNISGKLSQNPSPQRPPEGGVHRNDTVYLLTLKAPKPG